MEERDKLVTAKKYLEDLANGVDPLSGKYLPEDSGVNNIRVSRCLFYVSSVLDKLIENGGLEEVYHKKVYENGEIAASCAKKIKKHIFHLSDEEKSAVDISETPIYLSDFVDRVNANIDLSVMKKVSAKAFTDWMIANGILEEKIIKNKNRKFPTELGNNLGIFTEKRTGLYGYGDYVVVLYQKTAQEFLLDNLDEIVSFYYN